MKNGRALGNKKKPQKFLFPAEGGGGAGGSNQFLEPKPGLVLVPTDGILVRFRS